MLERGGCVVVDGPLDDPLAQELAMVARRAPDPSLTVLRLDRRIWPNGPPRGEPAAGGLAGRHAVPGPDLQPAGRDAGGAGGAARGADRRATLTRIARAPRRTENLSSGEPFQSIRRHILQLSAALIRIIFV